MWLIIRTPVRIHCWPVGDDETERAALVTAGRVLAGVPADDNWVTDGSGYDIQVTAGEPHPLLLEAAAVGTIDDLRQVDAVAATAYEATRAAWSRDQDAAGVAQLLAQVPADTLTAALARLPADALADVAAATDAAIRIPRAITELTT